MNEKAMSDAYGDLVDDFKRQGKKRRAEERRRLKKYPGLKQRELRQREELKATKSQLKEAESELNVLRELAHPIIRRIGMPDIVTAANLGQMWADLVPWETNAETMLASMMRAAEEAEAISADISRRH